MSSSMLAGFSTGTGLILAIGAQNAFVLRQGLRREHVLLVCLLCAVSDALLVAAGVAGVGSLIAAAPALDVGMRVAGAAFLGAYALKSARRAWAGGQVLVPDGSVAALGAGRAALTCLALTWLNPHVYLDTLVLLGGLAARDPSPTHFGLGAVGASFAFFFALGFGARLLAPLFARPAAWRLLDGLVALLMAVIALSLVS